MRRPRSLRGVRWLGAVVAVAIALPAAGAMIALDTVFVGNVGNAADPRTGHGAVDYGYYIGKYEVTNAQYATFLNAVDPGGTNPYGVYNPEMSNPARNPINKGGLDFVASAAAGTKYRPKAHYDDKPVNFVDFYGAARFANWLGTGQTETGFYELSARQLTNGAWVSTILTQGRHGDPASRGLVTITDENEWYKAAYHRNDGDTANYFLFPTGHDQKPTQAIATAEGDVANPGENVANYHGGANWDGTEQGHFTTVGGAGVLSASPYGTYDQGGNAWEWLDTPFSATRNVIRGTSQWIVEEEPGQSAEGYFMQATHSASYQRLLGGSSLGFRVSSLTPITAVPLPASVWLLASAMIGLSRRQRDRVSRR